MRLALQGKRMISQYIYQTEYEVKYMNEENNYGGGLPEEINYIPQTPADHGAQNVAAPVLDDFDYAAPQPKNDGPQGVAAPVLDDMDYYTPSEKRDGPQGVAAPVLDDMDSYSPAGEKRGAPQVEAPVLDDGGSLVSAASEKLVLSDEDVIAGLTPELKQQFDILSDEQKQQVIDMRRQQLGAVAPPPVVNAAILDEDNYTPPPKREEPAHPAEPVQAAILDEEPDLPKPQTSSYEQQELERIKAEAAKKAVSSSLVSEQKDEKESLRMMLELKEEQRLAQAAKGFKITIILAVIGTVAAIAFYLLYTGKLGIPYLESIGGKGEFFENVSIYVMLGMILGGVGLISGIKPVKTIASLIYLAAGIIQIFPGLTMIPLHEGSIIKVILLYIIAFGGTLAVFLTMSGSECVGQYFSKRNEM